MTSGKKKTDGCEHIKLALKYHVIEISSIKIKTSHETIIG